ncbi:MAG: 3-phosphoglycerate dehydrogenase [Candidatus Fluviicola riflensis]|nr:MAG: 3-phosphoglycerate dehydrogenase [Candidatus Fluviicola riflensis]OGS80106.1 MAG: 3-phosphoglycerate dehydrogenase [Candidatus Fluviicola riflensis]OGS87143.1 MAG: 3-phosphoglycerate dehydrogenase [Fluviicola sp. RIFCSPHIGHO2_01_FULL_43_53]OGS90036.1 MAG: 3-phosphoglycerate dehydrogenase [Fluviicola sp. RIFCSPHIGHO2_12_FULL_43_24]
MKILANDGISNEGKSALEKAGYTVITEKVEQADLATAINEQNIEIVLVRSATTVRKEVIDACPGLKLIGRGGVGMDNIDVAYAREKGVTVINTPASSSQSVAELVMGHFFAGARSLHHSFKNMETGDFSALKKRYAKGTELRGKTLLIIGFGRIGQSLASYALGCGMKVLAVSQHPETIEIPLEIQGIGEIKVPLTVTTDLNGGLAEADFISLHVPKQPNGDAVLGDAQFELMKKGVILVNAARGGVVNEDALLAAIAGGKVAFAGLDVFENEPNPRVDLLNNEAIGTTPHVGAATVEAQDRIGLELADLIIKQFGNKVYA